MSSPFLSLERLDDATKLINLFSQVIGEEISSIDLGSGSYSSPTKDDTQFTIDYGGTINDYAIDISGSTSWNDTDSSWAGTYGDKGSIEYDPVDVTVTGLGSIVESGFSTIIPESIDTSSSSTQTLSLSMSGTGDVDANYDFDIDVDIKLCTISCWTAFSQNVGDSGTITADPADVSTDLDVVINYDDSTDSVSLGDYSLSDLSFSPNLETTWESVYSEIFGSISDWWNSTLGSSTNPFEMLNNAVKKQVESGDDYLDNQVESVLSNVLNESSVKPYLDASIAPLLAYSWNFDDYPVTIFDIRSKASDFTSVIDGFTGDDDLFGVRKLKPEFSLESYKEKVVSKYAKQLELGFEMSDFTALGSNLADNMPVNSIYDDFSKNIHSSRRGQKPNHYVFHTKEKMRPRNADVIEYFDPLTNNDKIVLSGFKFEGLSRVKFAYARNRKEVKIHKGNDSNIIFNAKSGRLLFDQNESDKGLGRGGVFAIIEDASSRISKDDFLLINNFSDSSSFL